MPLLGVKFGTKHSFTDYGMYLQHREIGFPEVKTEYVYVPGTDGDLDFTEVLSGTVNYGNRVIILTFKVTDNETHWVQQMPTIAADLHGKKMHITFDDDELYYYNGRIFLTAWESSKLTGQVSMEINCDPYKCLISDPTQKAL